MTEYAIQHRTTGYYLTLKPSSLQFEGSKHEAEAKRYPSMTEATLEMEYLADFAAAFQAVPLHPRIP